MTGNTDCDGITAYNYLSGEHITEIKKGSPMYFRTPASNMNLANFMRAQIYSAFATLKLGMDILFENENVNAEIFRAHGGLFKVEGVAQQILADALNVSVSVAENSGEGGAWGIALLSLYMMNSNGKPLGEWLSSEVFDKMNVLTLAPEPLGSEGFSKYIKQYQSGLTAEKKLDEIL